jgi:hypothetical protein
VRPTDASSQPCWRKRRYGTPIDSARLLVEPLRECDLLTVMERDPFSAPPPSGSAGGFFGR